MAQAERLHRAGWHQSADLFDDATAAQWQKIGIVKTRDAVHATETSADRVVRVV